MSERPASSPAAVSDDVVVPTGPRAREMQLLLAVAITASLPRVLWGLTMDARRLLGEDWSAIEPLFGFLRYGGLVLDVACLVMIGLLHPLDQIVPKTNGKRVAVIVLGGLELCLAFLPLLSMVYDVLGSASYLLWSIPSFASSLAFAVWLAALLKPAGKAPMLVVVVVAATVLQVLGQMLFGGVPLLSTVVGVLVAVEVLRVRRAIE